MKRLSLVKLIQYLIRQFLLVSYKLFYLCRVASQCVSTLASQSLLGSNELLYSSILDPSTPHPYPLTSSLRQAPLDERLWRGRGKFRMVLRSNSSFREFAARSCSYSDIAPITSKRYKERYLLSVIKKLIVRPPVTQW